MHPQIGTMFGLLFFILGITVTPAVSRQTNQQPRPQPRNTGQSPILNIGSGISITSSSQNRNSGGFAVPGPRRNIPIVNHNVERPERCTTVDLTQDDEPPNVITQILPFVLICGWRTLIQVFVCYLVAAKQNNFGAVPMQAMRQNLHIFHNIREPQGIP